MTFLHSTHSSVILGECHAKTFESINNYEPLL